MTEENQTLPPSPAQTPEPMRVEPPRPPKKRLWLLWLWLILLGLLGASGWLSYNLWLQIQQAQSLAVGQNAQTVEQLRALQAQTEGLRERLNQETRGQVQALENRLRELEQSIGDLYARTRKVGDSEEQSLAETAYLLRIAQQRLSLGHDVEAALAALEAADQRLKPLRDPRFLAVREQLVKDLNRLREIDWPDIGGAALRLQDYAERVDQLPLLQGRQQAEAEAQPAQAQAAPPAEGWQAMSAAVWAELRQLVVIRYNDSAQPELLAPEQRYFLTQNLRLKLETARFALLRRDTGQFHAAVQQASAWLARYYDQQAAEVQALQQALAPMLEMELAPPLPDISRSLALLQQLSAQPPAEEPAAPAQAAP